MLSKNPKKRPTIGTIDTILHGWNHMPERVSFFEVLHAILEDILLGKFSFINLYQTVTIVVDPRKEKIVSKSRPMKMKKDNRMLQ